MTPANGQGLMVARGAWALLRALGGVEIAIRHKAAGSESSDAEAVDQPLSPAVVRSNGKGGTEVLIAALSVQALTPGSAGEWFANAIGIVHDSALLRIENIETESFAGVPYLYRLTVST